jgi:hypothetical protein
VFHCLTAAIMSFVGLLNSTIGSGWIFSLSSTVKPHVIVAYTVPAGSPFFVAVSGEGVLQTAAVSNAHVELGTFHCGRSESHAASLGAERFHGCTLPPGAPPTPASSSKPYQPHSRSGRRSSVDPFGSARIVKLWRVSRLAAVVESISLKICTNAVSSAPTAAASTLNVAFIGNS